MLLILWNKRNWIAGLNWIRIRINGSKGWTKKLFAPPVLSCIDEFEEWLHETEIWQCLTYLDKDKQGPAIYLSLDQKNRKTYSDNKVKDLNGENGVDILVNKLKSLFAKILIRQLIWPIINLKLLKNLLIWVWLILSLNLKGSIITSKSMKRNCLQEYWPINC